MQIYEPSAQEFYTIEPKRNSGDEAMPCPKCSHLRKKKNDPCFAWNHQKLVGYCNHCQSSFVIKSENISAEPVKVYALPKFNNNTDFSENMVKYFQARCISQKTLLDFKVTEGIEFMPATSKPENTIQFNYFREGMLINTKFRDRAKHFKLVKDAELILYNMDSVADSNEMIICEGEPDAMSWHEAGYKFVVSVPNGAGKNQKLEWLDNCFSVFDNKKKIYLSTDNDEPGMLLRDELARRLGYDRCYKLDFGKCKDANEFLIASGPEKLFGLLETAKEFPMKGVFSIDDVWSDIENIYENGMPTGSKTGDYLFDRHLGCMPGELTMITGIPGHGKSIYLDQISLGLCIHSDWCFGVCSPESHPMAMYFTRLIKRLVGKKFSKHTISPELLLRAKNWVSEKYHLIKPDDGFSLDSILTSAATLVARKGIKGLILDPWNRIENTKPKGMTDGEWIVHCLIKIISFAQKHGVHVFLVAHPTKMGKKANEENFDVPNLYSISGSAHFFNMTQNGITIYRNMVSGMTEVHFQKIKWEHLGYTGTVEYNYYEPNSRFYADGMDPEENWLKDNLPTTIESLKVVEPSDLFTSETVEDYPF